MLVFRIRSNDSADSDQVKNRGAISGRPAEPQRQSPCSMASARASGSSGGTRMLHDSSRDFANPPDIAGHERSPAGQRLAQDVRQSFGSAWKHGQIGGVVPVGQFIMEFGAQERDAFGESANFRLGRELTPKRAISNQVKVTINITCSQPHASSQEDVEPLDRDHSTDPNDDAG